MSLNNLNYQFQRVAEINAPFSLPAAATLKDVMTATVNPYPNREYSQTNDLNQNVGWAQTVSSSGYLAQLFSDRTIQTIQQKASQALNGRVKGIDRVIRPSERVVRGALQTVYMDHSPNTGDIYGKFTVLDGPGSNYNAIVDKTVSMLVQGIEAQLNMEHNNKFSAWDARVLGDFNAQGVRRHDVIKLRERGPDRMQFHMKY